MIDVVVPPADPTPENTREALASCVDGFVGEKATPAMLAALRLELEAVLHCAGIRELVIQVELAPAGDVTVWFLDRETRRRLDPATVEAIIARADADRSGKALR